MPAPNADLPEIPKNLPPQPPLRMEDIPPIPPYRERKRQKDGSYKILDARKVKTALKATVDERLSRLPKELKDCSDRQLHIRQLLLFCITAQKEDTIMRAQEHLGRVEGYVVNKGDDSKGDTGKKVKEDITKASQELHKQMMNAVGNDNSKR
jgi:hypothetical protein